ncbi:MAG: hypothetical protein HY774_11825 [Acidobacteria bacterium]|nr:hypothetical protein [Acidobacteriota bacterium]
MKPLWFLAFALTGEVRLTGSILFAHVFPSCSIDPTFVATDPIWGVRLRASCVEIPRLTGVVKI